MYYQQGERDWVEWLANQAYRSVINYFCLKDAVLNHCYLRFFDKKSQVLLIYHNIQPPENLKCFCWISTQGLIFIWCFRIFFFSCYDLSFGINCFCFWQLSFLALWKKRPPALPPELGNLGTDLEKSVMAPTIYNLLMA